MTKTLEKQLNKLTLEELFIIAQNLDSSFWTYKDLKDSTIDLIKNDELSVATYILNTLHNNPQQYYNYDAFRGVLTKIKPLTTKNDFIELLKNYNDEDIKKVLKKYQDCEVVSL